MPSDSRIPRASSPSVTVEVAEHPDQPPRDPRPVQIAPIFAGHRVGKIADMGRLFGTDGVRGVAGAELSGELAFSLGRAAVIALTEHGERRPHIAVGRDTRASGEFLEAALSAGICSAGGDVISLGVVTTPAVAFLTRDLGMQAGAMISASHNPAEDNGIKFFAANGYKLADELEDEVERLVESGDGPRPSGRDLGRISAAEGAEQRYLAHLEDAAGGRLDGLRVVVDCANGAASALGAGGAAAPRRRRDPDQRPARRVEHQRRLRRDPPRGRGRGRWSSSGADAGVAHDGDADRAIFADADGRVIDGDQVLAACALAAAGARATLAGRPGGRPPSWRTSASALAWRRRASTLVEATGRGPLRPGGDAARPAPCSAASSPGT